MKSLLCLCLPVAVMLMTPGCVVARYTKTRVASPAFSFVKETGAVAVPQSASGEKVTFSVYALFANEKVAKIAIDKATKATTTGVSIGSAETDIDDQAVQAVVQGVVEGIVKGVK